MIPPDLVLEVDLTALTNIRDYEDIGVPEIWIYRARSLQMYQFDGQHYQEQDNSPYFPQIDLKQIIPTYVEQA